MRTSIRLVAFCTYIGCIVGANWALERWGFVPLFGITALGVVIPAGTYFAGLALVARDALREVATRTEVLLAILAGAVVAWWIEPAFAVASGVAFGISELADAAAYEPLRVRHWVTGVWVSQLVGSIVDSVLFLWVAFSFEAARAGWFDLTLGKFAMFAFGLPLVWAARRLTRVAT